MSKFGISNHANRSKRHAKDLGIKEFDLFFWPENAGLRHPVILVDRKLPGSGFDGFGEKGLHRWLFNCAAGDGPNPEQKREMSATLRDRSPPREVDKAFWVDAVVLGE